MRPSKRLHTEKHECDQMKRSEWEKRGKSNRSRFMKSNILSIELKVLHKCSLNNEDYQIPVHYIIFKWRKNKVLLCQQKINRKIHRFWSPSMAFFHCHALCFGSSNDITFLGWNIYNRTKGKSTCQRKTLFMRRLKDARKKLTKRKIAQRSFIYKRTFSYIFDSDKRILTVHILKWEGLDTCKFKSLELSDHIIFPFTISFDGST